MLYIRTRAGAVLRLAAVIGCLYPGVGQGSTKAFEAHTAAGLRTPRPQSFHESGHSGNTGGGHFRQKATAYEPYAGSVGDPGCKRSVPGVCWRFYTGHFAIPACMVDAESHGLVHEHSHPYGSSGLYQLELSNWEHYKQRGWPAFPYEGSKLEQSIVAYDVLHAQGIHAWSTAAGCGY